MSDRKSFKVSEEEYKMLQRIQNISTEEKQHQRQVTLRKYNIKMKQFQRMIDDKKVQLKAGIFTEKTDSFVSGKKPEFMLLNEIDEIEEQLIDLREANDTLIEEYDKDKQKEKK